MGLSSGREGQVTGHCPAWYVMRLVRSYPEEALWEPVFWVWHLVWRKINDE